MTASIRRHGLMSARRLLDLFEVEGAERERCERRPRPTRIALRHPVHGEAMLTDQSPLSEKALAACLDDGLTPADWLAQLNARVFFWADKNGLKRLSHARANRAHALDVLVVDTLALASAYAGSMHLSPINSGATIRRPARRGLATFQSLAEAPRRGRRILEVTVLDGVPDLARYLLDVRPIAPGQAKLARG